MYLDPASRIPQIVRQIRTYGSFRHALTARSSRETSSGLPQSVHAEPDGELCSRMMGQKIQTNQCNGLGYRGSAFAVLTEIKFRLHISIVRISFAVESFLVSLLSLLILFL